MLEKIIERHIVTYAEEKGIISYKFSSPANRSVPDRIFINEYGVIVFIEFKAKGKRLGKLQQLTFDKLKERGCNIYAVDSIEVGTFIIDNAFNIFNS
jgi:uncharacterized Rmd1/YagE family protein